MSAARARHRVRALRGTAATGGALLLSACGRLDELTYQPETTPEQWCDQRPCVEVGDTILNEPLGTFLVFLLAGLWVASGVYFLRTRRGQRSREWLGIALILGGIGAALAGVSYQAFSYELKCAGLDLCRLTNGWEVGYSLTQACSASAVLIAVAHACTTDRLRRGLIVFAIVNAAVYLVVTVIGVLVPSAVLLSFAVLMLFALPGIVIVIVVAGRRYRATRDPMDRSLVIAAVLARARPDRLLRLLRRRDHGRPLGRRFRLLLLRERRPARRDDPVALVRGGRRGPPPAGCLDRDVGRRRVTCGAWTSS